MKKFVIAVALSLGLAVGVLSAPWGSGWGWSGTVSTNTVYQTMSPVNQLSVNNSGSVLLFCQVNTASNQLWTAATNGTAVVIPPDVSFTFDCAAREQIVSVSLVTTNSSVTAYVAGF